MRPSPDLVSISKTIWYDKSDSTFYYAQVPVDTVTKGLVGPYDSWAEANDHYMESINAK